MGDEPAGRRGGVAVHHPPGDAAYEALLQAVRTFETMQALFAREVATKGLSIVEFDVLGTASDLGECSQRAIAGELLITRAGVGKAVDRLERRGLVRRRTPPGDARVRLVTLTPEGEDLLGQARIAQDRILHATVGTLKQAQQTALFKSMRQIGERAAALLDE